MYEYFLHITALNCVIVFIAIGTQLEMHVAAALQPARVLVMAGKHISKPKEPIKAKDFVAYHQWAVGKTMSIPTLGAQHRRHAINKSLTP